MIPNKALFNDFTLNIFTDASIAQFPGEYISCPGCHVCTGDGPLVKVLEQPRLVLRRSTNNQGEATAVLMGVYAALKYRNDFKIINIISDSKITIFGVREWIFNWVNNVHNGVMYSSSGKPVANQEILLQIIYLILFNNLKINFYHQRGHMNPNKPSDIMTAKKDFIESNFIQDDLDIDLVKNLILANSIVDNFTRVELEGINPTPERLILPEPLVKFQYSNFDIDKYKNLIHKKEK